ncbi:MAG TPA: hypothetical protein PKE32_09340, partial [Miltoncostaeaceae bacterium]|nr:hypothetical protein [Miltoncostaeaceae bacterium]
MAHLSYPGCPGQVFAFPCPNGRAPLRLDAGMAYLGVALARAGYAVLIPDLGPLYVGADIDRPYDQRVGFARTVAALVARARAGARGESTRWGGGLRGRIAPGGLAVIAHSRSGPVALATARTWWHSRHPVRSVLIYGGALEPGDRGVGGSPPPPPDVPVLALVGTEDRDTDWMAAAWLSAHIAQPRRAPALAAAVPGLGHTLVNRTLARRGIDDRICAGGCASAAEHRSFLAAAARAWLGATGAGRTGALPVGGAPVWPAGSGDGLLPAGA